MYVAIKEQDKIHVGISYQKWMHDMSEQDALLSENVPMWKISGHKGWYVVCSRVNRVADILRYKKIFEKEITFHSILQYTVPTIKKILKENDLMKEDYCYNEILIFNENRAYALDGYLCLRELQDFEVMDNREDIARGSIMFNCEQSAKVRIREAFRSLEMMRGTRCFPAIYINPASGEKETWCSYEDACKKTQDEWTDNMQELYKKALQVVMEEQEACMSLLQRKLCIGYYKAGLLIERMEKENYIEGFQGGASRKVLITKAQFDENFNI